MPGIVRPVCPATLVAALLILLPHVTGCGGGGSNPASPGGNNGGNGAGPMSATIDGQPWTASANAVNAQTNPSTPGVFLITGSELTNTSATSISLTCYNIEGPGTYPFGVNTMVAGGLGIVATAGAGWTTPLSGASGTLTITALDVNHIAGTFAFTAGASTGSATTATTVTNGVFDVPLPGTPLPPLPAHLPSRLDATIAGSAWNAATIVASAGGGNLAVGASNTQYFLNLIINGGATPGTYPLGGLVQVLVNDPTGGLTGANCCWGGAAGGTGNVTVATVTADRATGSFNVTLNPQPGSAATQPAVVAGSFDVGLP
jgi:hypothetical protein